MPEFTNLQIEDMVENYGGETYTLYFEAFCAECGAGICNKITVSRTKGRSMPCIEVEPCGKCKEESEEKINEAYREGKGDGYVEGKKDGYDECYGEWKFADDEQYEKGYSDGYTQGTSYGNKDEY